MVAVAARTVASVEVVATTTTAMPSNGTGTTAASILPPTKVAAAVVDAVVVAAVATNLGSITNRNAASSSGVERGLGMLKCVVHYLVHPRSWMDLCGFGTVDLLAF